MNTKRKKMRSKSLRRTRTEGRGPSEKPLREKKKTTRRKFGKLPCGEKGTREKENTTEGRAERRASINGGTKKKKSSLQGG